MQDPTDPLSAAAHHLLKLTPDAYVALVPSPDGGSPEARDLLESIRPAQLLAAGAVKSDDDGQAMLAGLWLWHDGLDESHAISQGLPGLHGQLLARHPPGVPSSNHCRVGHPEW